MKKIPDDAIVRLIDLPPGIGGAVMEDEDGFYSIYVNARHGHRAQRDDLDHELAHIENGDLHSKESVRAMESRAAAPKSIPYLMKARDLLPQNTKNGSPRPVSHVPPSPFSSLTPRQSSALSAAISALDALIPPKEE